MASQSETVALVEAAKSVSAAIKAVRASAQQLLANNSAKGVDWGNLQAEFIDADGDVVGSNVSPAEVSNVLGSLTAFDTFWTTHGGNFEKLTAPIV